MQPADPRDRRIAELEAQLAAALVVIDRLTAQVETLTARVQELEAKLAQTGNSARLGIRSRSVGPGGHSWRWLEEVLQ